MLKVSLTFWANVAWRTLCYIFKQNAAEVIRLGQLAGVEVLALKPPVVIFFLISLEATCCYRQSICLQQKIKSNLNYSVIQNSRVCVNYVLYSQKKWNWKGTTWGNFHKRLTMLTVGVLLTEDFFCSGLFSKRVSSLK